MPVKDVFYVSCFFVIMSLIFEVENILKKLKIIALCKFTICMPLRCKTKAKHLFFFLCPRRLQLHLLQIQELQMIVSGSWDKSIRFWDGKNQNPQLKLDLSERVYSMDVVYPVMVVGKKSSASLR